MFTWPVGLLLGVTSALAGSVGFLMRHRGAAAAPDVDVRRPLHTVVALFREKWWTLGYGLAFGAWLLHVTALKLAPLSLVQVALATSFVFLGVLAERFFGLEVRRRQWWGIGLAAAGLALLGATSGQANPQGSESSYSVATAVAVEAGMIAAAFACIASPAARRVREHRGVLLAAGAGFTFTVSHIGIKALTGTVGPDHLSGVVSPWVPVIVAAFVVAFFASARSLQINDAVAVIAVTNATGNIGAIFSGIVVFHDPLGSNGWIITMRVVAFALVVASAALMPAPVRAAAGGKGSQREQPRSPAAPPRTAPDAAAAGSGARR